MITFVNVFTVLPEKQADALQKIQQVHIEVVKHLTIPKSRHHHRMVWLIEHRRAAASRRVACDGRLCNDSPRLPACGRYFGYARELFYL